MKKIIKIMLLMLLCVVMFAACDDGEGENPAGQNPPPAPLTLVSADKNVNYSVVLPDSVPAEFRSSVRDFMKSVKTKTGASAEMPLILDGTAPNTDLEITVNVVRNRPDVAAVFSATPYNSARVQIVGNRIAVTAFTDESLETVLNNLLENIKQDEAGNWILEPSYSYTLDNTIVKPDDEWKYMSKSEQAAYTAYVEEITALPKFEGANLTTFPLISLLNDEYEVAFQHATKAEYDAYLAKLEAAGFEKYAKNVVPAGSRHSSNCNAYHTYTKDNIHIFTAWQGNLSLARIIMTPSDRAIPSVEAQPLAQSNSVVQPTVSQMHITGGGVLMGGGGMSYVAQLADGKFIVIDGGVSSTFSANILAEYLEERAIAAGMEKPVIAMWLFSHPHADHIGLAKGDLFTESFLGYAKENGYTIESIAYNFTVEESFSKDEYKESGNIMALELEIKRQWPGATVYTPRAGQIYHFAGMDMEILSTEEDVYPLLAEGTHNGFCINWRMKFDNGKTFMFLADSTPNVNKQLSDIYGDYLKSDVLQMAHHGLTGAQIDCYKDIDPDVCLWPTTYQRFSGIYHDKIDNTCYETYQYTLGAAYQEGDEEGNPTKYGSSASCIANRWIRGIGEGSSTKEREHYHISQTTIVNAKDLTVTVDDSHNEVWVQTPGTNSYTSHCDCEKCK